jgi:F420-dependent oxidoreductase-like protein
VKDLVIGLHIAARDAQGLIDGIVTAEQAGIDVAWLTSGGVAPDPLAVFAAAALGTERIDFGTSIIPTFPRHPLAMVQGAVVVDNLAPGRLRLGVGPSHKPTMERMFNLDFVRPLEHLREYVTILNAMLKDGKASFHGKRLHAEAQLAAPAQVRVMISALRHNAFRLAGELADGGISWVTPMPHIRDVALPAIKEGATAAGRATPPIVAHVPLVVSEDADAVFAAASRQIGFYQRVPFYSAMWQEAGFPEAAGEEFTRRMCDALVVSGNEQAVSDRLRTFPRDGASEVIAMPLLLPEDRAANERTIRLLGELARAD